jgi:hypothetical protein
VYRLAEEEPDRRLGGIRDEEKPEMGKFQCLPIGAEVRS